MIAVFRYIIVNGRSEAKDGYCAFCGTNLVKSYARDLETGLTYHTQECLKWHEIITMKRIGCIDAA